MKKMSPFKKNKTELETGTPEMVTPENYNIVQTVLNESRTWYQKRLQTYTKIAFIQTGVIFLLVLIIFILLQKKERIEYFAVDESLKFTKIETLAEPIYSLSGVMEFASSTIRNTFLLDYLTYKETLASQQQYYSSRAFETLIASLKSSKVIEKIKSERLTTSCTLLQAPRLIKSFMLQGRAAWKIEIPIIISYESSFGVVLTQRLVAEVLVIRADLKSVPKGILLQQVILRDFKNDR